MEIQGLVLKHKVWGVLMIEILNTSLANADGNVLVQLQLLKYSLLREANGSFFSHIVPDK